MSGKISEYANQVASLEADDRFDVSEKVSVGPDVWATKYWTGTDFLNWLATNADNFAKDDLTVTATRTHNFAGYTVTFDNGKLVVKGEDDLNTSDSFTVKNDSATEILKVQNSGDVIFANNLAAIADGDLGNSQLAFRVDESIDELLVKYKDAGGTVTEFTTGANLFTADLTLTANKVHDLDGFTMKFKVNQGTWANAGFDFINSSDAPILRLAQNAAVGVRLGENLATTAGGHVYAAETITVGNDPTLTNPIARIEKTASNKVKFQLGSANLGFTVQFGNDSTNPNYIVEALKIGNTSAANSKSILDIVSTTQGILPPRMTGVQADAITAVPTGLMLYCTDATGATVNAEGLWIYKSGGWTQII